MSDDDDDDNDDGASSDASFDMRKRARVDGGVEIDPKRRIRSFEAFSEGRSGESLPLIDASQIASPGESGKYIHAFEETDKSAQILLQYPSASQKERSAY